MQQAKAVPLLEVFYGISSPWAYLGAERMAEIAQHRAAGLRLRPIRIIEANGGVPLRTRPAARQAYHAVELARWSRHLGVPLNLQPEFYPCRTIEPAAMAVIAVQRTGLDAVAFSFAVQRALWAEDRDIADLDTLREIACTTIGDEGADLVVEEQPRAVVEEWRSNLGDAERIGIFGTPTYVTDGELYWGQDRLDFVDRALEARQRRRLSA